METQRARQAKTPALDWLLLVPPLASLVAFLAASASVWKYTVDDSFITFRYASNFAEGLGLNFNPPPFPRAEGYTSLLWTFAMSIVHLANLDPVLWSKYLGVFFVIGAASTIFGSVYVSSRGMAETVRIIGASCGAVLFVVFPYSPVHAVSGMETALAAFLFAAVTACFILASKCSGGAAILNPVFCFLLGIARPEANLFCGAILVSTFLSVPKRRRRALVLASVILYLLPGCIYFFLRFRYYGLMFPLPFYIKSNQFGLDGLWPSYEFFKDGAFLDATVLLTAFAVPNRSVMGIIASNFLMLLYFLQVQHIMGFGDRYFFPLVPALAISAGFGITNLVNRYWAWGNLRRVAPLLLLLFAGVAIGMGSRVFLRSVHGYRSYAESLEKAHIRLGHVLGEIDWKVANPVLAIGDAGAVPYYSDMMTIDTYGLNDAFIATHFGKDNSEYVLARHPDVIVLISKDSVRFEPRLRWEAPLWRSACEAGYDQKRAIQFAEGYYLWVIWQSASQHNESIETALDNAFASDRKVYNPDRTGVSQIYLATVPDTIRHELETGALTHRQRWVGKVI